MATESKFSKIKKGEYFRFKGKRKVYIYDGGGSSKGYKYTAADNMNDFYSTKTDRVIEIGFTY